MHRARLFAIAPVVIVMLVVGGCGSASSPTAGGSAGTTVPPRLDLASSSGGSKPAAADAGPAIFPQQPAEYVLDGALPDLGASAQVWRMRAHDVTEADVERVAAAVGLTATPTRTPNGWQVQGAAAILSFLVGDGVVIVSYSPGAPDAIGGSTGSGSGSVSTPGGTVVNGPDIAVSPPVPPPVSLPVSTVPPPTIAPPPAPVDVPDASDATTIAHALLDRAGVLGGSTWSTAVNDSGGVAISCAVGRPCPAVPPEVSARTVTFSLILDGRKVDGVNWSVTLGEHRRVESVYGEWAEPVAIGSYPLRSTAGVFADLQHGTAKYTGPQPMTAFATPGIAVPATKVPTVDPPPVGGRPIGSPVRPTTLTVKVVGASLGIAVWTAYDDGHTVADLVPTYRFRAQVGNGDPYDIVVLALDPGAATFTAPPPTTKPEPPVAAPATGVAPAAP